MLAALYKLVAARMERYKCVGPTEDLRLWDTVIHTIVRPPKMDYDPEDIGPEVFMNKVGTRIRRHERSIPH